MAQINKEKRLLELVIDPLDQLSKNLKDTDELLQMAEDDQDFASLKSLVEELKVIDKQLHALEVQQKFRDPCDPNDAYVEIQAGSGGTEAQDWAEMLLRLYTRWAARHEMDLKTLEHTDGDIAGIKHVTLKISGPYAYGWLRTETGVHRLVRKSPFDSGNRRHTSFASVFVSPDMGEQAAIELNMGDCRIDTYRSSGAGGQHVNTTDSAVRITHVPTGLVVQCQSDRSQHKNKAQAISQLKSKLYTLAQEQAQSDRQQLESTKSDITWGSQIRSYILDDARIKDLRTGIEVRDTQSVLNGEIDQFIEGSLGQLMSQED
jgi:peptide chain release factor 2